jgi:hypothetical protein
MNPTPPTDPVLDALANPPYVDDAGFTARVLAGLPRPSRARAIALAAGGLASAGVAGLVLAGPLLPLVGALSAGWLGSPADLLTALVAVASPLATAAVVLLSEPPRADARAPR